MKILSKFKDFYDHVAHIYGGGDPKIIYKRDRIKGATEFEEKDFSFSIMLHMPEAAGYTVRWLSVCGKLFLILKMNYNHKQYKYENYKEYNFHILCPKIHADVYDQIVQPKRKLFGGQFVTTSTHFIDREEPKLDELSKLVEQPVFVFTPIGYSRQTVRVMNDTINLGMVGFAAYYSPEQTYQNIAHYITNVMRESPDTQPPVNVSDKDLIVAKGFDSKISFRHRPRK